MASPVIELQSLARRRWPRGRHPGGLGWEVATDQLPEMLEVYRNPDGVIAGWAGIERPGSIVVEADADIAAVALERALGAACGDLVQLHVAATDDALRQVAVAEGFEAGAPWFGSWRTAAVEDRPREVGGGCTVRAAREDQFGRVERTPLYDRSLDLVVEAPGGELVGCCTAWLDVTLGVAEIEPLGIAPSHRRIGLAGALCIEVSARVAERGGREAFINAGPRADYPASSAAYAKAGFDARVRGAVWELRR